MRLWWPPNYTMQTDDRFAIAADRDRCWADGGALTEEQYWVQLYMLFKSLDERAGIELGGWCDWLEPRSYRPGWRPACVLGRAGFICDSGRDVREWSFRLLLDRQYSSVDEIQWERQLPEQEADWLQVDASAGLFEINPIGA